MRSFFGSGRTGLATLFLGTALAVAACAPAAMDKEAGNNTGGSGGSKSSGSGGSGGSKSSGSGGSGGSSSSGGSSGSGSGGSSGSGTGGSSGDTGGSSGSGTGGSSGSGTGGSSGSGTGGSSGSGTGGSSGGDDAGGGGAADMGGGAPSFAMLYTTIFMPTCGGCHKAGGKTGGIDMSTEAMAASTLAKKSTELIAALKSTDKTKMMPKNGKPLSADQIASIQAWIDAGAMDK